MNLQGAEVVSPQPETDGNFEIDLAPNFDHIVIFKQN